MAKQAAKEVAKKQTLEQWWAEEADRLNQFATSLQSVAVKLPEREERDFSEWESLVDEEYRAFCPGVSPPDNSCPPSNKGDGSRVQNQGRRVRFGTITKVALDNMRATGGFSVHPITGGSPTTGYMVSVKPEAEVVYDSIDSVNEAAFRDFYRQNKETFKSNPNLHFGGWVDTNTGKVYFDLSARYDNVREAVNDAKATNQLAIWHLDEGREIRQEDYDARYKQGRSQATRAVRLPRRTGRRRGAGLQGDGGGVSGVRPQGHGRQAVRTTAVSAGRRRSGPVSGRAFCPGVSPPDNSCSPANKGTGKWQSPEPPEPSFNDTVITGRDDPRGALTGHDREQRMEYEKQTAKWLADRGIELRVKDDIDGPPTIGAMQAAMRGVELLEKTGMVPPKEILIENISGNAPAGFDFRANQVIIDPDFDTNRLKEAVETGYLAGVAGNEEAAAIVHEIAHRDHAERIREAMAAGRGKEISAEQAEQLKVSKILRLIGSPDTIGSFDFSSSDPWNPSERFGFQGRLSSDAAREVARSVSGYAALTPMEFVAEVRTGAAMGIKYTRQVMSLYEDYLGPPLSPSSELKEAA
jgi:hypothetical protein